MDKKNLVAFLALSLAVLMLSNLLFPPPQPKPKDGDKAEAAAEAVARPGDDEVLLNAPEQELTEETAAADEVGANAPVVPADSEVPLQFVSLGSLDRDSGFRMLLTLTNQGAAVKRAELASPRFRDLVDRSGYLGHLELETTPEGLKVQVVGPGTPAARADLRVGDVITSIQRAKVAPTEVKTVAEFEAVRTQTRPGQEFVLSVVRVDGAPHQLTAKLTRRPLEVMRPEIDNLRMRNGTIPDGFVDPPSFLTSMTTFGGVPLNRSDAKRIAEWLEQGKWGVNSQSETSVTFERQVPAQKLKLIKRYTLEPVPPGSRADENYPGYNLRLDVEVQNIGDAEQTVAYRLDGPTGLPLEGWWYTHKISQRWFSGAGLRDVVVRFQGLPEKQIDCSTIAEDKDDPMGQGASLAYVGVDAVYFAAVLIPVKSSLDEDWFDSTEAIRIGPKLDVKTTPVRFANVSCRMTRKSVDLAPGQSQKDSYVVFIGPKRPELLAQYKAAGDPNYSLKDIIYYGMWPFGAVARGMLSVLHFFYGIVGNFGIAIVMLTVLVRGAMFPISFKQTQNMARMQALKPELDRINEKYKTDMQKRSAAMQEVYRKNKINPLGGCLPVVLQLPIFIGLYRSIMVDVELRQSPLFGQTIRWCSDLAAPDMLYNWSWFMPQFVNNGEGIFGLGPYFNVLPIVTVVLFLVSMKMSMPEPTNEQGVMQQKMMKYMTGFMGLLFYKVASGLCLYFIASSLWGLGERRLLKQAKQTDGQSVDKAPTQPPRDARKSSENGSGGSGKKGSKVKRKRSSVPYDPIDTIAAIATADGGAARGMVRVSGTAIADVVDSCFVAGNGHPLDLLQGATAIAGQFIVDLEDSSPRPLPCNLFLWPTAHSYTREPVAEFHTLGSPPLLRAVLDAVCRAGARLAEPGEFTLRAFLAGRIDLTQAEAVLGVIDAQGADELHTAIEQMAGNLARPLQQLRNELLTLLAELEAGLDFVEEDIEFISADDLTARLHAAAAELAAVDKQMSSRHAANVACQIVLVGLPNAGKSKLFNALVNRFGATDSSATSAIVSPVRGTTRDYLTAAIVLNGIRCELVDTAGTEEETKGLSTIAAAAQKLTDQRREQSLVRLQCVDASCSRAIAQLNQAESRRQTDIIVFTKTDITPPPDGRWQQPVVATSSVSGFGFDELASEIATILATATSGSRRNYVAATAERCCDSVRLADAAIARAAKIAVNRGGDELVAAEIRVALAELGKVVGAVYTDDLLDRIFKTFCIGK